MPKNKTPMPESMLDKLKYESGEYYRGLVDSPFFNEKKEEIRKFDPALVAAVEQLALQFDTVDRLLESVETVDED